MGGRRIFPNITDNGVAWATEYNGCGILATFQALPKTLSNAVLRAYPKPTILTEDSFMGFMVKPEHVPDSSNNKTFVSIDTYPCYLYDNLININLIKY